jgi:hypothetical protein
MAYRLSQYARGFTICAIVGTVAPAANAAPSSGATILLVVNNSAALDAQETAKQAMLQGWGYTVTPISASAAQASFDAACITSSCAYISETVTSTDLGTKLTAAPIPVLDEEAALSDEFGFASGMTTFTDSQINIISVSHYITSPFALGTLNLFSAAQPVRYLSGTLGSYTTLGRQVATSNATLAILNRGDTLTPSGAAAGKRVYLPWGNTGVDITQLTANGQTMMQRSIEWALMPVAWYKFDDGAGSTAIDSASGCNGTVSGASWTTGKIGGGLSFDGNNDYVSIPSNAVFDISKAFSVTAWVRATGAWGTGGNVDVIMRKGDANPCIWQIDIANGKLEASQTDGAGAPGATTLLTNKWYHVAGTFDGATVKLYVNGAIDLSIAYPSTITPNGLPIYIGGHMGSTDVLQGVLDDVRFYNRALTAGEIAAMANISPTMTSWESVAPP